MEVKKDLNNTQRKILEEVYINRVIRAKEDYKQRRKVVRAVFCEELLEAFLKTQKGKSIQKGIENLQAAINNASKEIEETCVELSGLKNIFEAKILIRSALYERNKNQGVKEFDRETDRCVQLFDDARDEVRAKVWGMDTSYQDIENEVDALIRGISEHERDK